MFAIFKREFKAYFYSPMAYVLIGLFTLATSMFFLSTIYYQQAEFNRTLSTMGFLLVFIVPILTMRILAEDRKTGTEVLLLTSPAKLTDIVIGKYLAVLGVFLVMTAITFIYPIILFIFGKPVVSTLLGGYIGFILLGATYIAVGVFASSLSENQVIAAIVGIVSLLIMYIIEQVGYFFGGIAAKICSWFSLASRYADFNTGVLNLTSVVYYLSFIGVFLFLTIRIIEKRRWSQG